MLYLTKDFASKLTFWNTDMFCYVYYVLIIIPKYENSSEEK